jgi:hypothetical protein
MNQQAAIIIAGGLIAAAVALTNHWALYTAGDSVAPVLRLNRWTGNIVGAAECSNRTGKCIARSYFRTNARRGCRCASSENSKANRIGNYERSGGIWKNLFGGSRRKIAKEKSENSDCYANALTTRSRMLLKGDEGGHYPWVTLGGGSLFPGSISALRVTGTSHSPLSDP